MRIKINEEVYIIVEKKVFTIQHQNFGANAFGLIGSIFFTLLLIGLIWSSNYVVSALIIPFLVGSALMGLINKEIVIDFNKNELTFFTKLANYVWRQGKTRAFSSGIHFSVKIIVDERYGNSYFLYTRMNNDEFEITSLGDYETGQWLIHLFKEANPAVVSISE